MCESSENKANQTININEKKIVYFNIIINLSLKNSMNNQSYYRIRTVFTYLTGLIC
jgi:hypothetical protein